MKDLAKILAGGFVVFMILAVGQRWEYFSSSWFGGREEAVVLTAADSEAAVTAVRGFLSASSPLLASAGDERFADRLDAGEDVRDELLADAAYLRHNRLRQVSTLVRFEVRSVEWVAPQRVEVLSREYWVHRLHARDGDHQVEPPSSQIVLGTYVAGTQDGRWRVLAWDFEPPADGMTGVEPPAEGGAVVEPPVEGGGAAGPASTSPEPEVEEDRDRVPGDAPS